jgi:ribosome maturation factor RimP
MKVRKKKTEGNNPDSDRERRRHRDEHPEIAEKKTQQINADDIRQIAEPLCQAEGIELVHVEYQRETGGRILRFYIDKPGGVRVDDCAYISRQLSDLMDVSFENIGPYSLEVSSPGPDRPLGRKQDFEKFRGHVVKIRTLPCAEDGKPVKHKTVQGVLSGISEEIVTVRVGDLTAAIPFREIIRARLVPEKKENIKHSS